jgi:hypothetical protein
VIDAKKLPLLISVERSLPTFKPPQTHR